MWIKKDHASRAVNDLCQEIGGCHVDCLNETVTIESLSYAFKFKILSDLGRSNLRFDILRIKYESYSQKNWCMESSNYEYKVRNPLTKKFLLLPKCVRIFIRLWIPETSFAITILIFLIFQSGHPSLTTENFSFTMPKIKWIVGTWKQKLTIYLERIHMKARVDRLHGRSIFFTDKPNAPDRFSFGQL